MLPRAAVLSEEVVPGFEYFTASNVNAPLRPRALTPAALVKETTPNKAECDAALAQMFGYFG